MSRGIMFVKMKTIPQILHFKKVYTLKDLSPIDT